eukprot:GHVR01058087.1.p1 GENE.GHVR01058087.1~~GHVR01058087.1.p1  ORF type:complete len:124 (-),score=0.71 GHVR01058087.1:511-882(-)
MKKKNRQRENGHSFNSTQRTSYSTCSTCSTCSSELHTPQYSTPPAFLNAVTTAVWPYIVAINSGVCPNPFTTLTLAPFCKSQLTESRYPVVQVPDRAVFPAISVFSRSAPFLCSHSITLIRPL